VTCAAYPTWFALSACCAAASGRMLITSLHNRFSTSLHNRFSARAWLSAATFALWSALITLFLWGMV
jgi:hypothetical protein